MKLDSLPHALSARVGMWPYPACPPPQDSYIGDLVLPVAKMIGDRLWKSWDLAVT